MKYCPTCQRTYPDGAQKFCLQDGTPLAGAAPTSQDTATNLPQPSGATTPTQQAGAPFGTGAAAAGLNAPRPGTAPPGWQPAPKRKIWPWVLGLLGLMVLGGIAVVFAAGFVAYRLARSAPPEGAGLAGAAQVARAKSYVNSRADFGGDLAEEYVDFSFNYPETWQLDPKAGKGSSPNFVKVERSEPGTAGGSYTLENFAVGTFTSSGSAAGDRALFPQLASQLSAQFSKGFPEYQKVSEGPTRVGRYDGYQFLFRSTARGTGKGDLNLYGRVVMVPAQGQKKGVTLVMIASSLAPGIRGVADVGVKGELPMILDSFRLGAPAAVSESAGATRPGADESDDSGGPPSDEAGALAQLEALEEAWAEANISGDREALDVILSDEYSGTDTGGNVMDKEAYLGALGASRDLTSQTFENLDVSLRGDTAVLTGDTTAKFRNGPEQVFRFTDTFKWRGGRWQAVSSHASPVK